MQGQEPYYIDLISDHIEANVLEESQKGFNLIVLYGRDVRVNEILTNARRFPMMSERQVVIVKEAQEVYDLNKEDGRKLLSAYLETPAPSTILVFCHKHWLKILIVVWVISFLISPYFFLAFAFIPFIFAKIGFGLLNTVGHRNGPSNVPWLNFFIAGEGYHKNHHLFPNNNRFGKWDLGGWLIEKLTRN